MDMAMGGGWPRGRIAEVYGPEASGKTTLALHAIVEAQRQGGLAAIVDVEHALDRDYARRIGVDFGRLAFAQPGSAEDALDIVESLVSKAGLDLVVVDSVAALVPEEEIEKGMGQATMGLVARLMSKAMRKLTPIASKENCTILFINQLRANIGGYGASEVTTGGNALKYYASVRVEIRAPKGNLINVGTEDPTGVRAKAKVTKNKCAPPHKTAEFDIMFGSGISQESSTLEAAIMCGIVDKKGAWFVYKDTKLQGRDNFAQFLKKNPDVKSELEQRVRDHCKLHSEDFVVDGVKGGLGAV